MKKMHKKGVFDNFGKMAISIAGFSIAIVVALLIISQGKSQEITLNSINESNIDTWTEGYNATTTLQSAAAGIPAWAPLVIIAMIGLVLLGIVKGYSGSKR